MRKLQKIVATFATTFNCLLAGVFLAFLLEGDTVWYNWAGLIINLLIHEFYSLNEP